MLRRLCQRLYLEGIGPLCTCTWSGHTLHLHFGKWRVHPIFAWYDFWIGGFYDQKKRRLYLMIPFVGIYVAMPRISPTVTLHHEPREEI